MKYQVQVLKGAYSLWWSVFETSILAEAESRAEFEYNSVHRKKRDVRIVSSDGKLVTDKRRKF